jgi:hydroxyacylglutathione hydrolase
LQKLRKVIGAPVMMHREDVPLYRRMDEQAEVLGVPMPEIGEIDQLVGDGDVLRWGALAADVMHTPGHSPGSISLYLPRGAGKTEAASGSADAAKLTQTPGAIDLPQLFAGDTLFAGSIGRTDLWGGSMQTILESLRGKLLQLPDDTIVHPGHGPITSIGEERQSNPFLRVR